MFGLIRKKDFIKKAVEIYVNNDTALSVGDTPDERVKDFYYRSGNSNALNALCNHFGISITKVIRSKIADNCPMISTCEVCNPHCSERIKVNSLTNLEKDWWSDGKDS